MELDDGFLWALWILLAYVAACIFKGEITRWRRSRILKRDRERREQMRREFEAEYQEFSSRLPR